MDGGGKLVGNGGRVKREYRERNVDIDPTRNATEIMRVGVNSPFCSSGVTLTFPW